MKTAIEPKINQSLFNEFLEFKKFKDSGLSVAELTLPSLVDKIPDSVHVCTAIKKIYQGRV